MTRAYTPEEVALLSRYVSDVEGDVYCIYNLPEEVIAVIFAYVSRSPLSFRDNLLKLLSSDELDLSGLPGGTGPAGGACFESASDRARKFHERWTVGYGHASVAEHAVVRVGIERVSRFASAQLEMANPYLSFTEYSQRYQRPQAGAYYVPDELQGDAAALQLYHDLQRRCYEVYEELLRTLHDYLLATVPAAPGEKETAWRSRLEKLAFEDARYALTLATHTNLGMTGNARAVRDALVVLLSDGWTETSRLAEKIRSQVERVTPTLLRYAYASPYHSRLPDRLRAVLAEAGIDNGSRDGTVPPEGVYARLVDWTGRESTANNPSGSEEAALDVLLAGVALAGSGVGLDEARARLSVHPLERKRQWAARLLQDIGQHDQAPEFARRIRYTAEFVISEANWHQLLRHRRQIDFLAEQPNWRRGLTIPPRLEEAGLGDRLRRLAEEVVERGESLVARYPQVAPYLVLNAHRRRVCAEIDLWQFYHLVNLRTSPEAQWDIRTAVLSLYEQVAAVHPTLVRWARRRSDDDARRGSR